MAERIVDRVRERVEARRARIRERIKAFREGRRLRGEIIPLRESEWKRLAEITERIEARKPGLIPRMDAILKDWYPGSRLVRIFTPKTQIVRPGELTLTEAEEEVRRPIRKGAHY